VTSMKFRQAAGHKKKALQQSVLVKVFCFLFPLLLLQLLLLTKASHAPEVTVTQLAETTVAQQFVSPIPAGRPRADEDKSSERDALQVEAHAECLAAVVTRNGTPPVMKFARVGFVFVPCFAVV